MEKIKLLLLTSGFQKGTSGGVAAFLFNYFSALDKNHFDANFLTIAYQPFDLYREQIEELGGSIYSLNVTSFRGLSGKISYLRAYRKFLSENKYDIIHVNMGSFFTVFLCSWYSKKYGNGAKIISHSHSDLTYKGVSYLAVKFFRNLFPFVADYFLACSPEAGEYMFPDKVTQSSEYMIMRNAIPIEKYIFNKAKRNKIRKEFMIDDKIVIGHVGRFTIAKNHNFLIDIFHEICRIEPKSVLLLVGSGDDLEKEIRKKVSRLRLQDRVIFTGLRDDVNDLLQAMDVFVMPSLFEGLGLVAIEAQACALPVLASTNVPEAARLTDSFHRLNLDAGAEAWAKDTLKLAGNSARKNMASELKNSGYDILTETQNLETLYIDLSNKN